MSGASERASGPVLNESIPESFGSHKREMFLDDIAVKKEKIDANMGINVEQYIIRKV